MTPPMTPLSLPLTVQNLRDLRAAVWLAMLREQDWLDSSLSWQVDGRFRRKRQIRMKRFAGLNETLRALAEQERRRR